MGSTRSGRQEAQGGGRWEAQGDGRWEAQGDRVGSGKGYNKEAR